ncbi:unnamed protein product, partial [Rotaria sp. Silwood2]
KIMGEEQIDLNLMSFSIDNVSEVNDEQQTSCVEPLPISENKCEKLKSCQHHICDLICHPRECQPCDQLIKRTCLSHGTGREVLCTNETGGTKTFTCGEPCGKLLSCDHHKCTKTCHDGPYPSCRAMKYDPIKNPFRCKQLCKKEKSCRKHRCNRICCNLDSHRCELVCGKILNCGIHKCKELCHFNFCRDCSLFDQKIKCHCGETVIKPKSKCLKTLRICYFSCKRTHECGYPANHWCYYDGECPPCTHSVSKMCVGEHVPFDVPCHVKTVCCRQPYGKFLPRGVHTYQCSCHSGLCQSFDQKCTQRCNIKRHEYGHRCNLVCHGSEPCPVTTCEAIIKVRCQCDSLIKDVICNVKSNQFNEEKVHIDSTSPSQALPSRTTS